MVRPTTISSILIETIDTSYFIVNVEEYCMHIGNDSALAGNDNSNWATRSIGRLKLTANVGNIELTK